MKILAIASILTVVVAAGQSLDDCLQSDSISCVQKSLYRKAKEFFDKDSLELFTGVSLVRNERSQGRSSRSGKELMYEQEIDSANSVTDRQAALENFVSEEAGELLTGRSLRVNRITFTSCESPLSRFILKNSFVLPIRRSTLPPLSRRSESRRAPFRTRRRKRSARRSTKSSKVRVCFDLRANLIKQDPDPVIFNIYIFNIRLYPIFIKQSPSFSTTSSVGKELDSTVLLSQVGGRRRYSSRSCPS